MLLNICLFLMLANAFVVLIGCGYIVCSWYAVGVAVVGVGCVGTVAWYQIAKFVDNAD